MQSRPSAGFSVYPLGYGQMSRFLMRTWRVIRWCLGIKGRYPPHPVHNGSCLGKRPSRPMAIVSLR